MTSKVMIFESVLQERGLNTFAQWGPMIIPNAVASTDSPIYNLIHERISGQQESRRHTFSLASNEIMLKNTTKPPNNKYEIDIGDIYFGY